MRNTLLGIAGAMAIGWGSADWLYTSKPIQHDPFILEAKVPTSFEIDKWKSRWLWADGEIKASKYEQNWIKVSLYSEIRKEYEAKLAELNVCRRLGDWVRCDGLR